MFHVYYHSEDLDGICSMFIMKFYFKQMSEWTGSNIDVKYIPCAHGMVNPRAEDLNGVSQVFFCDYFPSPYEESLLLDGVKVTVLDHHKSAIDWIKEHPEFKHENSILDSNYSGMSLS